MASYTAPLAVTSSDLGLPTRSDVTGRPTASGSALAADHGIGPRAAVADRPTPAAATLEEAVGLVGFDSTTIDRLRGRYTQVVNGLQPQAEVGTSTRTGITRPTQTTMSTLEDSGAGAYIPEAYFRTVRGVCVDTDGKPITKGEYLLAFGGLPTVGQVDDSGRFEVPVLKNTYTDFVLVTSSGREGVDYAWFTPVDTRVPSYQDEATLIFERRELTGLYAGQATQMGGSLR